MQFFLQKLFICFLLDCTKVNTVPVGGYIFIVHGLSEERLISVNWNKKSYFLIKMAQVHNNEELMDIVLVYGEARQNSRATSRLYIARFPNRHLLYHEIFQCREFHIFELGKVR